MKSIRGCVKYPSPFTRPNLSDPDVSNGLRYHTTAAVQNG
jgi:hypothetical protein